MQTSLKAGPHDLKVSSKRSADYNSIQTQVEEGAVIKGEVLNVGIANLNVLDPRPIPICNGVYRSLGDLCKGTHEVGPPVAAPNHTHLKTRQSNRLPSSKARQELSSEESSGRTKQTDMRCIQDRAALCLQSRECTDLSPGPTLLARAYPAIG